MIETTITAGAKRAPAVIGHMRKLATDQETGFLPSACALAADSLVRVMTLDNFLTRDGSDPHGREV
jgi:hypothetical protein